MGIIALLGALVDPLIQLGLEKAHTTTCISNLHQIYDGLLEYATDHNEQLPVMLTARATLSDPGPTLDTALVAYLPNPSVFHCPDDHSVFAQSGSSYLWVYGLSVNAQGQPNVNFFSPAFPLLQATLPSQIPFVSDQQSFHSISPGTHIVYADGHIK